jgi:hypothetical protein
MVANNDKCVIFLIGDKNASKVLRRKSHSQLWLLQLHLCCCRVFLTNRLCSRTVFFDRLSFWTSSLLNNLLTKWGSLFLSFRDPRLSQIENRPGSLGEVFLKSSHLTRVFLWTALLSLSSWKRHQPLCQLESWHHLCSVLWFTPILSRRSTHGLEQQGCSREFMIPRRRFVRCRLAMMDSYSDALTHNDRSQMTHHSHGKKRWYSQTEILPGLILWSADRNDFNRKIPWRNDPYEHAFMISNPLLFELAQSKSCSRCSLTRPMKVPSHSVIWWP